jgi:hypothetical protein
VELSEAFADGRATQGELRAARSEAVDVPLDLAASHYANCAIRAATSAAALEVAVHVASAAAKEAARAVSRYAFSNGSCYAASFAASVAAWHAASKQQATLVDDIAGPDPLSDLSRFRTPTVVALAEAMYLERWWADLPVLADALEEASCTDARVLEHLRGPGPHARGCHVLDLILQMG